MLFDLAVFAFTWDGDIGGVERQLEAAEAIPLRQVGDPSLADPELDPAEPIDVAGDESGWEVREDEDAEWRAIAGWTNLEPLTLSVTADLPSGDDPDRVTVAFDDADGESHELELDGAGDRYEVQLERGEASFGESTDVVFSLYEHEDDEEPATTTTLGVGRQEARAALDDLALDVDPDPVRVSEPHQNQHCDQPQSCVIESNIKYRVTPDELFGEPVRRVEVELHPYDHATLVDELEQDDDGSWFAEPERDWDDYKLDPDEDAEFSFIVAYDSYRVTETVTVEVVEE